MKKVILTGYISLDSIINISSPAKIGRTSLVINDDNSKIYYGGCVTNIACAISKLGINARPIIRVGQDYESTGFKNHLESFGVDTIAVEKLEDVACSRCYLVENQEGDHITLFYPGAQDPKHFSLMDESYFDDVDLAVVTVGNSKDTAEFYKHIKTKNIPLVFSARADFESFSKEVLEDMLYSSEIIFMNEVERKELVEHLGIESYEDLAIHGKAKILITTLGAKGSEIIDYTSSTPFIHNIGIYPCEIVVDMTGCGDGYVSGFLYGYLNNEDIETCGKYAAALASFVLEKQGCCTNLPSLIDLKQRANKL